MSRLFGEGFSGLVNGGTSVAITDESTSSILDIFFVIPFLCEIDSSIL